MSETFEQFEARLEAGASAADELVAHYSADQQFARVMKRFGAADQQPPAPSPTGEFFKQVAQERPVPRASFGTPIESFDPQLPTTKYQLDIDTCQE